jgi:Flp pilus assembly protein CpaB
MRLTTPAPPSNGKTAPRPGPPRRRNPLSTRRGTLVIAGVAALLALAALLLFLNQYRASLADAQEVPVLVAKRLLPKGMPGRQVAEDRLYKVEPIPQGRVPEGAMTDPNALTDKLVREEIYPGHQLEATDFERADGNVLNRLEGYNRAMTVPVDIARGMVGNVKVGDKVDVIATFKPDGSGPAVARMVARDALVVTMPKPKEGTSNASLNANQPATLRVKEDRTTLPLASGADSGKIWLVLRPPVDPQSSRRSVDSVAAIPLPELERTLEATAGDRERPSR